MRRIAAVAAIALLAACDLPRDPRDTTAAVAERRTLRVGVVEHPPAIRWQGDRAVGPEADLVASLAAELGARPVWVRGAAEELYAGLEAFALDLVVGAVPADSPWKKRLAFSRPTLETAVRVGFSPGQPTALEGASVACPAASDLPRRLRRHEASPRLVTDVATAPPPIAAEEWQLAARGLVAGEKLAEQRWVWAAPPGENGWLHRVDRFLVPKRSDYEARLAEAGAGG